MNILIVYAHPEPQSLNGSLKDFAITHLRTAGHNVQFSDLMLCSGKLNWMPVTTLLPQRTFRFILLWILSARLKMAHKAPISSLSREITLGGYGHFPVSAVVVFNACHQKGWG